MKSFHSLSKRERLTVILTGMFVLAFSIDHFVLRSLRSAMSELNETIDSQELRLKRNLRLIKLEDEIKKQMEKSKNRPESVSRQQAENEFLNTIEKMARKSQTTITNIKPRTNPTDSEVSELSMDIEIETSMENLVVFLYAVEKESEMKVEKMNIRQPRQSSSLLKTHLIISKVLI